MKAWLTNGLIAWEIPAGRTASLFLQGVYLPSKGWWVTRQLHREEIVARRKKIASATQTSRLLGD